MRMQSQNRWEHRNESKDAARLSSLMGNNDQQKGDVPTRASIPMPPLERGDADQWDVRGAMTLEGYQRLRKGYERGINPEALERMEEHGEGIQQFPPPAPSYRESIQSDHYQEEYRAESQDEPIEPTTHYKTYGDESTTYQESFEPEPQVRQRRIGPITVTLILLVGIVGGLLLYAGGIEYISDLFRKSEPVSNENLTLVTERPHAEPEVNSAGALTPGEQMEMDEANEADEVLDPNKGGAGIEMADAEIPHAAVTTTANTAATTPERSVGAKEVAADKRASTTVVPTTESAAQKKQQTAVSTKPTTAATATTKTTAKPTTTTAQTAQSTPRVTQVATPKSASSGSFTVQVRATPNKDEADRIARTLRSKGGEDVHIVATEKNGETVYRVRFGSFGSAEEGKAKAGTLGFGNVWVVKR